MSLLAHPTVEQQNRSDCDKKFCTDMYKIIMAYSMCLTLKNNVFILQGDYEARAEVMSSPTGPVRACYDIKVSLVSKAIDCNNVLFKYGPLCRGSSGLIG